MLTLTLTLTGTATPSWVTEIKRKGLRPSVKEIEKLKSYEEIKLEIDY